MQGTRPVDAVRHYIKNMEYLAKRCLIENAVVRSYNGCTPLYCCLVGMTQSCLYLVLWYHSCHIRNNLYKYSINSIELYAIAKLDPYTHSNGKFEQLNAYLDKARTSVSSLAHVFPC